MRKTERAREKKRIIICFITYSIVSIQHTQRIHDIIVNVAETNGNTSFTRVWFVCMGDALCCYTHDEFNGCGLHVLEELSLLEYHQTRNEIRNSLCTTSLNFPLPIFHRFSIACKVIAMGRIRFDIYFSWHLIFHFYDSVAHQTQTNTTQITIASSFWLSRFNTADCVNRNHMSIQKRY